MNLIYNKPLDFKTFVCICFQICKMCIIHSLLFNSLRSVRFVLKEINTFINQGCIKLIKSKSKVIYNVAKDFYLK